MEHFIKNRRDLTKELKKIGMTNKEFMSMVGYSTHTLKKWSNDKVPIWVNYVVRYLQIVHSFSQEGIDLGIVDKLKEVHNK